VSLTFRRDPYPSALDGELIICDVPVLVGLAAIRRLDRIVRSLPALRYALPARAELSQCWVDGIAGAAEALDAEGLDVNPTDSADPAVREALFNEIDGLGNAWRGSQMTEVEARSAAASFAVARHRRVTLLTHRSPHWNAGMPRNGPRRVLCVGGAELALWLARAELSAAEAWEFYCDLATTTAGEQPRWPLDEAQGDFVYWAGEAAAGRL
jgi:hypothetical protein